MLKRQLRLRRNVALKKLHYLPIEKWNSIIFVKVIVVEIWKVSIYYFLCVRDKK